MKPPTIGPDDDAAEIVSRHARELAHAQDRVAVQLGDTEWLVTEPFDVLWTLPDGTEILIEMEHCHG